MKRREQIRALEKAIEKVEDQQRRVATFAIDDHRREAELRVLETLLQGASLARMACSILDEDDAPVAPPDASA